MAAAGVSGDEKKVAGSGCLLRCSGSKARKDGGHNTAEEASKGASHVRTNRSLSHRIEHPRHGRG